MLNVKDIKKEKIVVIADDLTGAGEIAAILKRNGKRSLVINNFAQNSKIRKLWNSYEAMVFNLNTRSLPEDKAYNKIKDFLSRRDISKNLIYKKIDSTMRGNVGREIDAILDEKLSDIVVVVPALPDMGRITVGGYHLVNKIPLNKTFYAENSTTSFLPLLLQNKSKYQTGYINLQTVERGQDSICGELVKEYKKGKSVFICDCCTEDNLKNIKNAIFNVNLKVMPAGSAGLFEELFSKGRSFFLPCLIICGSLNQITRNQLTRLIDKRAAGYLELDLSLILSVEKMDKLKSLLKKGESILDKKHNLIIATEYKKISKDKDQIPSQIRRSLFYLVNHFINNYQLGGIVVSGGDTAMSLLDALSARELEIIDELEPLVPIGVIKGGKWEGMIVITKTGGFGGEDVFLKAVDYINRNRGAKIER